MQADLCVDGEQRREIRRTREGVPTRKRQRRYCISCQLGVGSSSSSARPPFGSWYENSAVLLVEPDLELPLLHAVVEPGAAEDDALQPVDERLAVDEGDVVPVPNEIAAERAARLLDPVALDELDQVGRLVVVELVASEETELDGGCRHTLREILGVEAEAVARVLDDVVVAGVVVPGSLHRRSVPWWHAERSGSRSPSSRCWHSSS